MVGFTATMLFGMRLTTGVIGSTIMERHARGSRRRRRWCFFGAAMNWRKAGALALALVGVAAINLLRSNDGGGDALLLGAALVSAAVCLEAGYTLLSRKLSDGITSLEATLAASLVAIPLFVPLALLFDTRPFDFSRADGFALGALFFLGGGSRGAGAGAVVQRRAQGTRRADRRGDGGDAAVVAGAVLCIAGRTVPVDASGRFRTGLCRAGDDDRRTRAGRQKERARAGLISPFSAPPALPRAGRPARLP